MKCLAEGRQVRPEGVCINFHPKKEPLRLWIGELVDLHEVAALLRHPSANPRKQPDSVGTGEFEQSGRHSAGAKRPRIGPPRAMAPRCKVTGRPRWIGATAILL